MEFSISIPENVYYLLSIAVIIWAVGSAIGNVYSARMLQLEIQKLRAKRAEKSQ